MGLRLTGKLGRAWMVHGMCMAFDGWASWTVHGVWCMVCVFGGGGVSNCMCILPKLVRLDLGVGYGEGEEVFGVVPCVRWKI